MSLHPSRRLAKHSALGVGLMLVLMACGAGGSKASLAPGLGGDGGYTLPPPTAPTNGVVPVAFEEMVASPGTQDGQVELRFAAPNGPQVTRYDVRVHVRHLSPDPTSPRYAGNAPAVTTEGSPSAPGQPQLLTLNGLEQGQTLQISVRAERSGDPTPFSHGVGVRVPGRPLPDAPANATRLNAAQTISSPGYYLLTQDVSTTGTAFTIAAKGVTLDLGGHTVTYGTDDSTSFGVYAEYLYFDGATVIRNGTIRQGGDGIRGFGVHLRGGHDIRLSELTIDVKGPDTGGVEIYDEPTGHLRIDHCTIAARTSIVVDRHFPGVSAISVGAITQSCEVDHNLITHTPQWGIKVQGNRTTGEFTIHHNRVIGTKTLVSNGYMLGVYKPKGDIFENELHGESRGIHIDGQDNFGNDCDVHDNWVRAQDQPNDENPVHWAHGIRIETGRNANVYHNSVLVEADAEHAEAMALAISMDAATGVRVHGNRFIARSDHEPFLAKAFVWVGGATGDVSAADIDVRHNVFCATDVLISRDWASLKGGPVRENFWIRDLTKGLENPFAFERIDISDIWPSTGHRMIDPITQEDLTAIDSWASPAAWDVERFITLRVIAQNEAGDPIAGAAVTVDDRDGEEVAAGTTNAQGEVDLVLLHNRAANGPVIEERGPFLVEVRKDGLPTYAGAHAFAKRTALEVTLASAPTAEADTTAPSGPTTIYAHALSASRIRVRWTGAEDESGIAGYLIRLDDQIAAISPTEEAFLGGLKPDTTYEVCVRPIDASGNVGEPIGPATVRTSPEDRGL